MQGPTPPPSFLARLRRLRALRRDPARIGDAAVLQSALLGVRMSPAARAGVQRMIEAHGLAAVRPVVDRDALRRCPPGSFGRAFIEFCDANRIEPATISNEFTDAELLPMAAVARYITTHDLIHVLLGCDTSIPGELEVGGFAMGQRYFRASRLFILLYVVLTPLIRPHQIRRAYASLRRGLARARTAPMLLGEPLERWFADDLESVRARLGLRAPA
jgi:ubiquinone biosynthesis protein COQ4